MTGNFTENNIVDKISVTPKNLESASCACTAIEPEQKSIKYKRKIHTTSKKTRNCWRT